MDREIYSYVLGGKEYKVDPLRVQRTLWLSTNGELQSLSKRSKPKDNEPSVAARAQEALIRATREAFGFKETDPSSEDYVTEEQCNHVLSGFLHWLKKKQMRDVK